MEGLLDAARYDRRILIEKGLNAREIEISVLGNELARASIPGKSVHPMSFIVTRQNISMENPNC